MIVNTRGGKLRLTQTEKKRLDQALEVASAIAKHGNEAEVELASATSESLTSLLSVLAGEVPVEAPY